MLKMTIRQTKFMICKKYIRISVVVKKEKNGILKNCPK
jgi:hypothetical protein